MAVGQQRALVLIVARELASNLATPMFLVDAAGDLVYYNDAAEKIIGKPFAELGTISSVVWGKMLKLAKPDGTPLHVRESPPSIAFNQRCPAHDELLATAFDGTVRKLQVTAYPLFAKVGEMHRGAASVELAYEGMELTLSSVSLHPRETTGRATQKRDFLG